MNKLLRYAFLLFILANYKIARSQTTIGFNFSAAAQPVAGWINVHGEPSSVVVTGTDAATGITISSVSPANWSSFFHQCAFDAQGAPNGTFFPAAVMANEWLQYDASLAGYNAAVPQLKISGLDTTHTYTIRMAGSSTSAISQNPTRYTITGRTVSSPIDVNNTNNTANGATFNPIAPDAGGNIYIYVNTANGSNAAGISGVQVITEQLTHNPPVVIISSPESGDILAEDGNVVINATATEQNGSVTKVEFFADTTKLGEVLTPPYTLTWVNPDQGTYTITAKATDYAGFSSTMHTTISIEPLSSVWSMTGNIHANGDSNFVGTVDTNRLAFRTNNIERMSISPTGTVMVGTDRQGDSLVVKGTMYIQDTLTDYPLTINANSIYSPFLNLTNSNTAVGATIGERFYNSNGLVAQMFAGSPSNAFSPNGFAFHDISGGGFDFVSYQPNSFVSWGSNFKKLGGTKMIFYPGTGHLIIGSVTDSGNNKLQVNGNTWTTGLTMPTGAGQGYVLTSDVTGNATWQPGFGGRWLLSTGTNGTVYDSLDNVAIGTGDARGYKLAVKGSALFTSVRVLAASNWPDYVFKRGYRQMRLEELESYIDKHKHLPEMVSAAKAGAEGVDLGASQAALLKKVEELTLYLIDENKKLKSQASQIAGQNEKIAAQERQLEDQARRLAEQNALFQQQQREIDELKALIKK